MKFIAILLLAGAGRRFEEPLPKQFHRLSGKKVYLHTLEIFQKVNLFDEILLVVPKEFQEDVVLETSHFSKVRVIVGGMTRQESSFKALLACSSDTDFVTIHDGVRPFVSQAILKENVKQVIQYGAVDTCIPSFDTVVLSSNGSVIDAIPERRHYLRGQTPQSFRFELILKAHQEAIKAGIENVSDDCQLVMRLKNPVYLVAGSEKNIKITTQLDLYLAEQLMRMPESAYLLEDAKVIEGCRYIIIGGLGGIGSQVKALLEQEKAHVLSISRTSKLFPVDVNNKQALIDTLEQIHAEYGPVDGLINAAGDLVKKEVSLLSQEEIEKQLQVNLHAVIFACQKVCLKPGGHIVNIASSSFSKGRKETAIYSAAKAGVVNFTQGFAEENPDLYVNAIVPQRTDTCLRRKNFPEEDKNVLLDPKVVAQVIVNVLKQSTITGQIIEVRK